VSNPFTSKYTITKYNPLMKPEPVLWMIKDIWQLGKINAMGGFEKSGKTRLMNWMLAGTFSGRVLDHYAIPKRCLYLCGEERAPDVNTRVTAYADLQGIDKSQIDIVFMDAAGMRLDLPKERQGLLTTIHEGGFGLLVIDPLRRVHGTDEDKSKDMSKIYNDFRQWSNRFNLTIVLLHHTPKIGIDTDMTRIASWFRGSTDLPAILDTAQYVSRGKFSTESKEKYDIKLYRQGRFPPMEPLMIVDGGDLKGFELV